MIQCKNIKIAYDKNVIYENLNYTFEDNKIYAILGKSGCGKTTLFRAISGLINFSGEILPEKSDISMVFSTPRLIPSMTIKQNLKLILNDIPFETELKSLGIDENMYPSELSSGMAQRISLLRAFLFPSDAILLDEPFINLDIGTKYKLIELFKSIWNQNKKTALIITHDIEEAFELSDYIIIVEDGKFIYSEQNTKSQSQREFITDYFKKS